MLDPVQAVLLFVILLLSLLFIVLGVQVFLILKDLRVTIKKTNDILDEVYTLTENISEPINLIKGIFTSSGFLTIISKIFSSRKEKKEHA